VAIKWLGNGFVAEIGSRTFANDEGFESVFGEGFDREDGAAVEDEGGL
jgi:hypothetical protein